MNRATALALTVLASLVFAASAQATTFNGTAADWMSKKIDANIAYPDGELTVNWGTCDGHEDSAGCFLTYTDGTQEIRLTKVRRKTAIHELGHAFSARNLSEAERARLRPLLTKNPTWDKCGVSFFEDCAEEMFASAYMACAMDLTPGTNNWDDGYGWYPSRRTFRRVCSMIWRYA